MSNEKAKQKIKFIDDRIVETENNSFVITEDAETLKLVAQEALAELEQPEPIPDCKPEATEFMKRMEEKYNAIDAWDYEKQNYSEVVGDLHEACDLIDRQAAEYIELVAITQAIKESVFQELAKNKQLRATNKALEDKIRLMEQESINHA